MNPQPKTQPWLWITLAAVIIIGGGLTWWYVSSNKEGTTTIMSMPSPAITKTADETADWQTYKNDIYGFSFKYPNDWKISEKTENFGDARKYAILLNFNNGTATSESYIIEVFDSGEKTARQFVDSWYGELEGGPSNITDATINGLPVVKFFMEKAHVGGPAGSAYILFKSNSTVVSISTGSRTGNAGESILNFYNTISNDKILNQIDSTFQFTQ